MDERAVNILIKAEQERSQRCVEANVIFVEQIVEPRGWNGSRGHYECGCSPSHGFVKRGGKARVKSLESRDRLGL